MHSTVIQDLLGEEGAAALAKARKPIQALMIEAFAAVEAERAGTDLGRLRAFLGSALAGRPDPATLADPRQQPLAAYFPGLRAQPWWAADASAVTREARDRLEGGWREIRDELVEVCRERPQLFRRNPTGHRYDSLGADDWTVCNLVASGHRTIESRHFPRTMTIVEPLLSRVIPGGKIGFIRLLPGVRLPLHTDATNAQLTCHLPLTVPPGCGITVAGDTRSWVEGRTVFFDHCYPHEAWNAGESPRTMLLANLVHPDIRPEELRAWARFYAHLGTAAANVTSES